MTIGLSRKLQALIGCLRLGWLVLICLGNVAAEEVKIGDTRAQVVAVLGQPQGRLKERGEETLVYPRGTVILKQGGVTKIQLLSEEQLRQQIADRPPAAAPQGGTPAGGGPEAITAPPADGSQPVEISNNIVIVRARLNSHEVRLALDTGAAAVVVPPAVADQAGVLGSKNAKLIDAIGVQEHVRLSTADSLAVGSALAPDVPVLIGEMSPDILKNEDGQLGLSFLTNFIFRIDYERKLLAFLSPANLPKSGAAIPLHYTRVTAQRSRLLTVQLEVDGIPGQFLVDTGKSGTLSLESWFVEKAGLRQRYRVHPSGESHSILGSEQQEAGYLQSLKIGGYILTNLPTVFRTGNSIDTDLAGAIGGGIFHLFTLTFDSRGQQLWLEPNGYFYWQCLAWRTGMVVGGNWTVTGVIRDSRAAQAGLRMGDHILEIDGQPIRSIQRQEVEKVFGGGSGTPVRLRVQTARETARDVLLILP